MISFYCLHTLACVCVLSLYNRYHHNAYFMQQAGEVVRRKNINLFERFIQFAFDKQDGKVTLLTPEDKSKASTFSLLLPEFLEGAVGLNETQVKQKISRMTEEALDHSVSAARFANGSRHSSLFTAHPLA